MVRELAVTSVHLQKKNGGRGTQRVLAKPRYATFQQIALKNAHFYCQTVMGRVGCKLAPQAHGTLLFSFRHAACFLFLRHLTN